MGEFDDVLAMEPSDDWDDYEASDRPGLGLELPPLAAALHVPAATVELRGQVPDEVLAQLDALTAAPLVRSPRHVVLPLSFEHPATPDSGSDSSGAGQLQLTDHGRGELVEPVPQTTELVRYLATRVCEVAGEADPRQLPVPLAGVRLADGRGVLVLEPDRRRRHEVVAALVAHGAGYVGADHVVLQAGSRTVLACPTPLDVGPPVTADRVTPAMAVSMILVSDPTGGAVERLSSAHGCARLLVTALPGARDAHEVLRCVAMVTATAAIWSIPTDDTSAVAGVVHGLDATTPAPQMVSWRRPSAEQPDLMTIRFARGGVVVGVADGTALEIDESELPVIDALGWPEFQPDSSTRTALLAQLAAAGVDLQPVVADRPAPIPGPESFGLPDAPRGRVTAGWAGAPLDRHLAGAEPVALLLDHAACRGELVLDDEQRSVVSARAAALRDRGARADAALELVLAALEGAEVDPILLGPTVVAHDGALPVDAVERDHLDLLVPAEVLDRGVELLASAGAVPADESNGAPAATPGAGPVVLRVVAGGGSVDVRLHTRLAGGPFGELVDHDELRRRAVPIRVGERWVETLHPDDRFVAACVRVGGPSPASVWDLREVVLTAPVSQEGAAAAFEASARWGATRTVLGSVRLVSERLPGVPPWLVERATRPPAAPDRRRRGLRRR